MLFENKSASFKHDKTDAVPGWVLTIGGQCNYPSYPNGHQSVATLAVNPLKFNVITYEQI